MSLKAFHIIFVIFSTLLAVGVGGWCIWVNLVEGQLHEGVGHASSVLCLPLARRTLRQRCSTSMGSRYVERLRVASGSPDRLRLRRFDDYSISVSGRCQGCICLSIPTCRREVRTWRR